MEKIKTGIIGCGMISDAYFKAAKTFEIIEVAACADARPECAKAKGEFYEVSCMTVDELFADEKIEIVINLTPPKTHFEIVMATLAANKHSYSEKPFGVNFDETSQIMALAQEKNLRVGCAPDTFLGGGQQTVRKLLDDGWIGTPVAGTAIVMGRGPEKWPHAPFFYDYGAGPMLDLGPYYITALVNLLGPAKSVTAVSLKGSKTRLGGPETVPRIYPVNVTTHLSGMVEFQCGTVVTVITSFEVYKHGHAPIELYGSEGSIQIPDPNTFGGPVKVFRNGYEDWENVPLSHIYTENSRSIGVADMAYAIQSGREHRANGKLANHVLEIMLAFDESSRQGRKIQLTTSCERPAPLPLGLNAGMLDL
ncbi:MAG: Gfo/Idh/MocA family oxidoreductase [Victivallales bacterium]|nr:Gfo/Idh/MocA family oxidoreductase [Victivallales bacterium]